VSFQCVILVSLTLWQSGQKSAQALSELIDVDVRTIRRWSAYYREEFPRSSIWQKLRGRVPSEVRDDGLPGSLMKAFVDQSGEVMKGVVACICFLAGIAGLEHAK
jgi:hypothetical protein